MSRALDMFAIDDARRPFAPRRCAHRALQRCGWPVVRDAALTMACVAVIACAGEPTTRVGSPGPAAVAITHVTLIDGTGGAPRADSTVIVVGDRIAAVGASRDLAVPDGARIVDGRGRFVIPGLWDMHAHTSKTRGSSLALFVANGVTSVRDMGGDLDELQRWRTEIAGGSRVGPRIVMAGPILEAADNVARMRREGTVEPVERMRVAVADPDEAVRAVDALAARGVDFIKFRTVASLDVYRAIARAAAAHHLRFAGHADKVPFDDMVAADQSTLEHYAPIDDKSPAELAAMARQLVAHDIALVPTIVVAKRSLMADPAQVREALDHPEHHPVAAYTLADWREQAAERAPETAVQFRALLPKALASLRALHRGGVTILPGTDTGVLLIYPGASLHQELAILVDDVGLTPMEAIVAATRKSAERVGRGRETGTIEPGKLADLVVIDADPIADIHNTTRIAGVVAGGRVFDRGALDRLVVAARTAPDIRNNDWLPLTSK